MGMGIDIGVDTECDGSLDAHPSGYGVDDLHLGDGLDIEAADTDLK